MSRHCQRNFYHLSEVKLILFQTLLALSLENRKMTPETLKTALKIASSIKSRILCHCDLYDIANDYLELNETDI